MKTVKRRNPLKRPGKRLVREVAEGRESTASDRKDYRLTASETPAKEAVDDARV